MNYYVYGDMKSRGRAAVVFDEEESDEAVKNYSGWFYMVSFETREEAEAFCEAYNNYEGEEDVELNCCEEGCKMSAYEFGHWNGMCAYQ